MLELKDTGKNWPISGFYYKVCDSLDLVLLVFYLSMLCVDCLAWAVAISKDDIFISTSLLRCILITTFKNRIDFASLAACDLTNKVLNVFYQVGELQQQLRDKNGDFKAAQLELGYMREEIERLKSRGNADHSSQLLIGNNSSHILIGNTSFSDS